MFESLSRVPQESVEAGDRAPITSTIGDIRHSVRMDGNSPRPHQRVDSRQRNNFSGASSPDLTRMCELTFGIFQKARRRSNSGLGLAIELAFLNTIFVYILRASAF